MRARLDAGGPRLVRFRLLRKRLKPGVSLERARAETVSVARDKVAKQDYKHGRTQRHPAPGPGKATTELSNIFSAPLTILMAVGGVVLLIVCANVPKFVAGPFDRAAKRAQYAHGPRCRTRASGAAASHRNAGPGHHGRAGGHAADHVDEPVPRVSDPTHRRPRVSGLWDERRRPGVRHSALRGRLPGVGSGARLANRQRRPERRAERGRPERERGGRIAAPARIAGGVGSGHGAGGDRRRGPVCAQLSDGASHQPRLRSGARSGLDLSMAGYSKTTGRSSAGDCGRIWNHSLESWA